MKAVSSGEHGPGGNQRTSTNESQSIDSFSEQLHLKGGISRLGVHTTDNFVQIGQILNAGHFQLFQIEFQSVVLELVDSLERVDVQSEGDGSRLTGGDPTGEIYDC